MTDDPSGFRCSVDARARCDSLPGTAAPATGWLLVEHRGKWTRRTFEDSPPEPEAGRAIGERARGLGIRPLFVRRHGRRRRTHHHRFAVVDSRTETATWGSFERLADVVDREWVARDPCPQPLYLVCTHGRHDRCCAIAGRPVAAELARLRPEAAWECSHIGGDRFAGNLLVLPYGLYYGYVDPADVEAIVAATERREVHLPLFRGRSSDQPPVQAARIAVQADLGLTEIDALELLSSARAQRGWVASFRTPAGIATATVEQHRVGDARATCVHTAPVPMRELHVTQVVHEPRGAAGG